jgi:hypothetical protein
MDADLVLVRNGRVWDCIRERNGKVANRMLKVYLNLPIVVYRYNGHGQNVMIT